MHPAVQDVHAGHGHEAGSGAAQIGVEREAGRQGRQAADRQGNAEQGVGPQARFVRRAVQSDESVVNAALIPAIHAPHGGAYFTTDRRHGTRHPFAPEPLFVAVAPFHGLPRARARAGGDGGPRAQARIGYKFHLDSGIASRIKNLHSCHCGNLERHGVLLHGDCITKKEPRPAWRGSLHNILPPPPKRWQESSTNAVLWGTPSPLP